MNVKKIALTGAAALTLVAGGTAAGAAITGGPVDASGVVHGCYTNQQVNGSHVVVLQDAGTACPKGSTAISWNQQGPAGAKGAAGSTGAAGPAGATGAAGPAGPVGQTGNSGPPGPAGANGSTVLNGTGAPGSSLGGDGDFYIDTAADVLYGPKAAGTWPVPGLSLTGTPGATGPAGPAGPQGPAGATGATGPAGPSSLAALNGSPCTIGGHASTLQVSTDPTTGAVTMTCTPPVNVSVTVTGGAMTSIQIDDFTNGPGTHCSTATSCSYLATSGDSIEVIMTSGGGSVTGSLFNFTCPGSGTQQAGQIGPGQYLAVCNTAAVTSDYAVTVDF